MSKNSLKYSSVLILISLLSSCNDSTKINKSIDTVDLMDAYNSKSEVLLSQVAEKIEYIPLESAPNYIFEHPYTIAASDSLLVIIGFRKIAVFDRSTGKFKRDISSYGRGPNEYLYTLSNHCYNELDDVIYVAKNLSDIILGFSSTGTLKKTIKLPTKDIDNGYLLESPWPFRQKNFLGYSINYSGVNPYKIEEFDSNGSVINRYPNYNSFEKKIFPKYKNCAT
jgi:hypothetical protein